MSKKSFIIGIVLLSMPSILFAQVSTTTNTQATNTLPIAVVVDPGLVPDDFFYFLDRFTESLNMVFIFNKEDKARKHFEYAKERVAEMREVLRDPNAKLGDIATVKDNFETQVADAIVIVKSENDGGKDISGLARELAHDLDEAVEEFRDVLHEHGDETSTAENEIRAKLASLSPTDPQVQGLTQALESITKEKMDTREEENDIDVDFSDEQATFDDVMGKEMSAQRHIDEAMRLKARLEGLVGQLPLDVLASSQALLDQAKVADARGDFETAKKLSKQAKKVFEKAQNAVEESANEMKEFDLDHDDISDTEESQDITGVDDEELNSLESDIRKGEKMMEGLNR
jgi:chromosome segregation ATPase